MLSNILVQPATEQLIAGELLPSLDGVLGPVLHLNLESRLKEILVLSLPGLSKLNISLTSQLQDVPNPVSGPHVGLLAKQSLAVTLDEHGEDLLV